MQDPVWTSVIPPLLAIGLAIATRQVILSLSIGLWMGAWLLGSCNPLAAIPQAIDAVINVFTDPGDTRVLVFTLVIGGLIATIEKLGGVRGFIHLLQEKKWVTGPGRAQGLAFGTGVVVFIESNITLLIAGAISRPLFDRYRVSREKLAYIIDATSAPICVLIPLNAWGAVIVSLLASSGIENPIDVFIGAILLNFYAIFAVLVCALVIWSDFDIGPMRAAQKRTAEGEFLWPNATPMVDPSLIEAEQSRQPQDSAKLMLLPVLALVLSMPLGLFITGEGDLTAGSGSTSVLWAVLIALGVASRVLGSADNVSDQLLELADQVLPASVIPVIRSTLNQLIRQGTGAGLVGAGFLLVSSTNAYLSLQRGADRLWGHTTRPTRLCMSACALL